jgi:hypothetical protein
MVEVPQSHLEKENWHQFTHEIIAPLYNESPEYFLPMADETHTINSRMEFKKIAAKVRFRDYRTNVGNQKQRNIDIEKLLRSGSAQHTPCLERLAKAIAKGDSINFYGRIKLIYESARRNLTEDNICRIFLTCGDPSRYGVLISDPNPTSASCGYRLNEKFKGSLFSDCGCEPTSLAQFCDRKVCYRSNLNNNCTNKLIPLSGPTFEEFKVQSQKYIEEFFND